MSKIYNNNFSDILFGLFDTIFNYFNNCKYNECDLSSYLLNTYLDTINNINSIINIQHLNELCNEFTYCTDNNNNNNNIILKQVNYGINNKYIDVTSIIYSNFVNNNKLIIPKNTNLNELFSDPVPGVKKQLIIKLLKNNKNVKTYGQEENNLLTHDISINIYNNNNYNTQHYLKYKNILTYFKFNDNIIDQSNHFIIDNNINVQNEVNILHLSIDTIIIKHWSLLNDINEIDFKKQLEEKYINLIKIYFKKDIQIIVLTNDINNMVIEYLKNENYKYFIKTCIQDNLSYNDIIYNSAINMQIGLLCNNVFIGNSSSTFSKILNYKIDSKISFLIDYNNINDNIKNNKLEIIKLDKNNNEIYNFNIFNKQLFNLKYNVAVIFHIGNIDIFEEIHNDHINFFNRSDIIYFITTHKQNNISLIKNKLPNSIISIIPNKGMDIGGKLISIKNILNYKYYKYIDTFYFIHTKTNKDWREKMLCPLLNNTISFKQNILFNDVLDKPTIIGSYDLTYNNKVINMQYIIDIFQRNFVSNGFLIEDLIKYFDNYIFDINKEFDKDTFIFNSKFYKNYEIDLNNYNDTELINHYKNFGKNEFHRIPNPCYIKQLGVPSSFIAGTCFVSNREFIDIFKNINLNYEFEILEEGYSINNIPKKTHAWEYMFGLLCYLYKSNVYSITDNGIIINRLLNEIHLDKLHRTFNIQSVINIDPNISTIAFFLLIPNENMTQSGGYRTLINYISVLEKNNIFVDLYFGDSTNDMNITPFGLSVVNQNINELVSYINNFKLLDISKHNFFLGLNAQKKYNVIVANAWQISEAVWLNREKANNLAYIIQDEEELFYPDDTNLQQMVKNTYKSEFKYYCLSNYLYNVFKDKKFKCSPSVLGVNLNIYKNMNYKRNKSVIIAYYTYKVGRLPNLVEELIEKISKKYICYVFPCNYTKTKHANIINVGTKTIYELNEMYNFAKIGIIMSNTNPSRLGYEMLASGLKVIEYDSKFTKYDMPNEYFNKIKNSNNIIKTVDSLMNNSYTYPNEYVNKISCEIEHDHCLHFFKSF